jgi:coproporphyrinogen III oxidase-like Fe-S oxidoreductase
VANELGVGVGTLERWRSDALAQPERERVWTGAARFDAVLTTSSMDEASKSAWCRASGVYPQELATWRENAMSALGAEAPRTSAQEAKQNRRKIKELEREIRRKDKALAETAALLVLSKKVAAIFNRDMGEDE